MYILYYNYIYAKQLFFFIDHFVTWYNDEFYITFVYYDCCGVFIREQRSATAFV